MNKIGLLSGVAMTQAELAKGRFMRAPDGHGDGGGGGSDSTSGVNNSNVNPEGGNNEEENQDNTGKDLDLSSFWQEDEPDGGGNDDDDPAEASKRLGGEISQSIQNFQTAPFTKDVADAIANGDLDGINKALTASHQETIKQAVQISAKLVGAVMDRMTKEFDARIEGKLGQRDDTAFLESKFPLAKDPEFAPVVKRVWDQAMKNSKGDRSKAERLTRGMLDAFGAKAAPASLRESAPDATHGINTAASKSLVDQLLGRGE